MDWIGLDQDRQVADACECGNEPSGSVIILGRISRRWDMGIWTGLGWTRIDRWRTLVSAVMNLRVP